MKVLNNILKMEMSNIHLLKPSKNVRMKELFLWFFIFGIMVLYGGILLTQIKKTQIIENSLFYVYGLSLVAAIYDYGINIKRVLYDYEQYVLISYLPVKTFYIVLAKLMTTVVMTLRWNIVVGFSYTIVYVFQRNLPATYIILGLLLLIFASFLISQCITVVTTNFICYYQQKSHFHSNHDYQKKDITNIIKSLLRTTSNPISYKTSYYYFHKNPEYSKPL